MLQYLLGPIVELGVAHRAITHRAMVDPEHAVGERTQKRAVMADANNGAARACQKLLQPQGRLKVEMLSADDKPFGLYFLEDAEIIDR